MKLKRIAAFLYLAVVLAVAGACGGQAGEPADAPAQSPEQAPEAVAAPTATAEPTSVPTPDGPSEEEAAMARLPLEGRPALGPADAPVTLVEFTDYQCPFCGRHNNVTAPKLREHYGDMLRVVVLHFPLADIHPLAPKAAEAAECAADQGKFWEYNDTLHADQSAVGPSSLVVHAETLGLDTDAFEECLESSEKRPLIEEHIKAAVEAGARGTPFFMVNGQKMSGARSETIFKRLIDQVMRRAGS